MIGEELSSRALASGEQVLTYPYSELVRVVARCVGRDEAAIAASLRNFALWPRDKWDSAPPGFLDRDWYPWVTGRRLALLARPFLILDRDWTRVILAPASAIDSFQYVVERCYAGAFPSGSARTHAMRKWGGDATAQVGHGFNDEVAEKCRALGLNARASVSMPSLGAPKKLGDVD